MTNNDSESKNKFAQDYSGSIEAEFDLKVMNLNLPETLETNDQFLTRL